MYGSIVALALLGAVTAQTTTTEMFLVGFDPQPLVASAVASDATATTFSIACRDPNAVDCGVPASFTFTQGPSTIHYQYVIVDDGEGDNETIDLGCVITSSDHGTCSGTVSGYVHSSPKTTASTTTFVNGGHNLGGQLVTVTAGLAPAVTTASSTSTSSSHSSPTSSKTSASAKSSATSSQSSSKSSSESSVSSESSDTSTSHKSSETATATSHKAATGSSSSSSSKGGVPRITGNAQWVVGGAAAAIAIAAL